MKNKNFGRKRQAIYILSNRKSTRIIKTLMDFFFFIKVKIKMVCFSVPSLSDWGMFLFPCHSGYRNIVCYEYKHIDHFQPHNYFPAQSLHFRFGSVAPCPTLKSDVTASTPRTRYRRLAKPYLTGFSCCTQSAYKSKQSSLCSLEEIS